ncbi:phage major capsid protein [Loigolactobacillus coryniformis]|uniref:phage major capsid protein n=1 Tax=Loigolactobacillus coryniformis TaxID=1610 RepID=UPI00201A9D5A|nr:phage major capsid protein [Loigolactobacillus coryniformis]MCL5457615.1 phage major capsid protein [Loigolactobacillus coryniformis]
MTLDEKIKALKAKLEGQRSKVTALQTEVRSLAEKAENEADFTAAKAKRSELDNLNKEIRMNEENLDLYKESLRGRTKPAAKRNKVEANKEQRRAINEYIRSKGKITEGVEIRDGEAVIPGEMLRDITPTTDGISSPDAKPVIPVAISYTPQRELQTSVDLKQFTNVFAATTASGQYPILKNTTATLISVAELEKNPALAKPEFANVDWKIQTYRGAIPLSQESIDDAVVDLVGIVGENANQQKQNTTNGAVATVMKGFTAKSVNTLDDLKHINNVDLDPAYERVIVATQSFYNWLDTLKDGNGRYLLQDSIVSPSGKTVLNMPIFVIADTLFGVAGEAHAFIGDVKRAVIFANRSDVTVRWVDSEIYGQYLQVATRFDAKPADKKAGFFLTYTDEAAPKA